jgi:hypothetical protein
VEHFWFPDRWYDEAGPALRSFGWKLFFSVDSAGKKVKGPLVEMVPVLCFCAGD